MSWIISCPQEVDIVSPFMGEWIEMSWIISCPQEVDIVSPFMGEWIER
ncbi:hypothetical protein [Streptococcus pyogenes]